MSHSSSTNEPSRYRMLLDHITVITRRTRQNTNEAKELIEEMRMANAEMIALRSKPLTTNSL